MQKELNEMASELTPFIPSSSYTEEIIDSHILDTADNYIELYREYKEIQKKLDKLREEIEPYMLEEGLNEIETDKGKIILSSQERAPVSSRYTSYDLSELDKILSPNAREKCVVEVIDKEILEALCKIGEVPKDILDRKITNTTMRFSVKYH